VKWAKLTHQIYRIASMCGSHVRATLGTSCNSRVKSVRTRSTCLQPWKAKFYYYEYAREQRWNLKNAEKNFTSDGCWIIQFTPFRLIIDVPWFFFFFGQKRTHDYPINPYADFQHLVQTEHNIVYTCR